MKVLITEQLPGSAAVVAGLLGEAGHQVTYCHASGQSNTQCIGLTSTGRCPLADLEVAVAVDSRTHAGPMTAREFGALCALRHGTPLVVTGPVPDPAASPWRDADARCEPDRVVDACEEAAAPTGAAAHRAVAAAATRVLRQFTGGQHLAVSLRLRKGAVDAVVTTDRPLRPLVCEAIRMVVRTSLSPYTPSWPYADVRFQTA
jgi:hypothetical protein